MPPFSISTLWIVLLSTASTVWGRGTTSNTTFSNPLFPGWHSDPSCVYVEELGNTTFCTTSTFLNFPGLPIYASRDLSTWRHVSNAFSRSEQISWHASMNNNNRGGVWAPTIRYHEGTMYVIATYVTYNPKEKTQNLLFHSKGPYDDEAWSNATVITNPSNRNHIDPDLFWDDDGTVYMATGWGRIFLSTIDLETGEASEVEEIWSGTGGSNPEGPHHYKRDGFYHLIAAEGGSVLNHSATMARPHDISGPYESYKGNPVLTNRGTEQYFQSVGHADLFPDANGNWWAVALATRSGSNLTDFPMGRETVLTAVTWPERDWPIFEPVRGEMTGPLPDCLGLPPGEGPLVSEDDRLDFRRSSKLPRHFVHFRSKDPLSYSIGTKEAPNTLRLLPSQSNLTGPAGAFDVEDGVTFVGRKQVATFFEFSVDLTFDPRQSGEEAGATVFLNQQQHIDLSIVKADAGDDLEAHLTATSHGRPTALVLEPVSRRIPARWLSCPLRLTIAGDDRAYNFTVSSACQHGNLDLGSASSDIVSGGFMGSLVVVYATSNGSNGTTPSYWSRWRYTSIAQKIGCDLIVPLEGGARHTCGEGQ